MSVNPFNLRSDQSHPPPPQKVNYLKGKVGGLKREDEINFVLLKRGLIREGGGAIEDL